MDVPILRGQDPPPSVDLVGFLLPQLGRSWCVPPGDKGTTRVSQSHLMSPGTSQNHPLPLEGLGLKIWPHRGGGDTNKRCHGPQCPLRRPLCRHQRGDATATSLCQPLVTLRWCPQDALYSHGVPSPWLVPCPQVSPPSHAVPGVAPVPKMSYTRTVSHVLRTAHSPWAVPCPQDTPHHRVPSTPTLSFVPGVAPVPRLSHVPKISHVPKMPCTLLCPMSHGVPCCQDTPHPTLSHVPGVAPVPRMSHVPKMSHVPRMSHSAVAS